MYYYAYFMLGEHSPVPNRLYVASVYIKDHTYNISKKKETNKTNTKQKEKEKKKEEKQNQDGGQTIHQAQACYRTLQKTKLHVEIQTNGNKKQGVPGSFLVLKEALVMVVLVMAAGGLEETEAMEMPMGPTSPIPPSARRSEFRMASVTCIKQSLQT